MRKENMSGEIPVEDKSNTSQGEILTRLCEDIIVSYGQDGNGNYFVIIPTGNYKRVILTKEKSLKYWMTKTYREQKGTTISKTAIDQALMQIEAKCHDSDKTVLFSRIGWENEVLYYDPGRKNFYGIKLNPGLHEGEYLPPIFYRKKHQLEQVWPTNDGDALELFNYINVAEENRCLLAVLIGSYFVPFIPHPVLVVTGEQGTGKSFLVKMIVSLVDPSISPLLMIPKDIKEAHQNAAHHYMYALDNVSEIKPWFSDFLCSVVTGASSETRQLYTDDESFIRSFKGCPIINGIGLDGFKPDLLERSIIINLPKVEKRRAEEEILKDFESEKPKILGAFLIAVSRAMKTVKNQKAVNGFRMADFVKWGVCLAPELGFSKERFLSDYRRAIRSTWSIASEGNGLVKDIKSFLKDQNGEWQGSASDLCEQMGAKIKANQLSRQLTETASLLRNAGVEYENKRTQNGSMIDLKTVTM